ncbi:hypothetical protein D3C87_1567770 [compost metagenome]
MASAMITVAREGPSAATNAMARRTSGNAIRASITRAIGVSSFRKNPASNPRATPKNTESSITQNPTSKDRRAANIVRESTSRPNSSVPNQCATDGGFRRFMTDSLTGE